MAKIIFGTSLFLIFYAYFGYLALCIVLSKFFGRKLKKNEIFPTVSIIIPCHNEEKVIRQKLENSLSLNYPSDRIQIIVASESTDRTNEISNEYKDRGILLYKAASRIGKTAVIYNAIPQAEGEILVFSDANVMLEKDAVKKIVANFYEERVGAVSGLLAVTNPVSSDISWGEALYKKYETLLRKSNSRLGKVLNSDGALFAIRKKLYAPINPNRGDDFELVIRVLIKGYYSVFEPEAISYEDASITTQSEIERKIRMTSWFIRSALVLLKEMLLKLRIDLTFQIISHKLIRWLTPFFFIAIFLSNIFLLNQGLKYQLTLIIQLLGYVMGILGWYISDVKRKKPPFLLKSMHYFLMFNYAFFIGIIKGIFSGNDTSAGWEKLRT